METNSRIVRCLLLLSTVYGVALCGDWCNDGITDDLYCVYGCCGLDNSYCCSDSWGTGSIAGSVVGIIFFCVFVALVVVCCRRRYRPPVYIRAVPGNASIAVVSTQHTMATNSNMAAGYAPPMQQPYQKSNQPYPGQYPPHYPGQPGQPGMQQPPPYTPQ